MRLSFLAASSLVATLLLACSEPTTPAGAPDLDAGDGGTTPNEDAAPGADDGGTADSSTPPPAKAVVLGPEVTVATGGAVSTYGAWKDKVLYVVFDQAAKTYRVELAKLGGAAPKVLLQGTVDRFENYMFASGGADVARDVLVPGTGTNGATFVVAAPTSARTYEVFAIDAAAETSTKIDTVPYIGSVTHRNGFVFYWYAQQAYLSTAYSGPSALAWRAPNGSITRVPQAWRTPEDPLQVSADGTKVAYLAEAPNGNIVPPFETGALTLANANGTNAVKLGTGVTSSFFFEGTSLFYGYGGVQVAAAGTPPKELFRPNANGSYDWWLANDALVAVEKNKPNLMTVLPLAGGARATMGVAHAAKRTGKRVFYIPTGTSDLQIADPVVPLVPKFTVPDVVEPFVTTDGRWAALLRGPDTATRVDRVWFEGKIVDLADKAFGHYDLPNGIQAIASGNGACLNGIFDAVCVTGNGVVSKVRANSAYFETTVGANGLLYTSLPATETKPRIATVVVQGAGLAANELTKANVGAIRVSDTAIFYLVSAGTTASLAGRTLQ